MAKGRKHCYIHTRLSPDEARHTFSTVMFGKRGLRGLTSKWKPVSAPAHVSCPGALCAEWVPTIVQDLAFSPQTKQRSAIGTVIAFTAEPDSDSGQTEIQIWAAGAKSLLGMTTGSVEIGRQFKLVATAIQGQDPGAAVRYE